MDDTSAGILNKSDHHDRAWNDPPLFVYNVAPNESNSDKRKLLNERIAFPLTGSYASPRQQEPCDEVPKFPPSVDVTKPPVSSPPKCLSSLEKFSNESGTEQISRESDEERLSNVLADLRSLLAKCECNLQKRNIDDIHRRLKCLEDMWRQDKLNDTIKRQLCQLCNALTSEEYETANNIHLELIVNYSGLVSTWMVGIKHLIHQLKSLGMKMESQ